MSVQGPPPPPPPYPMGEPPPPRRLSNVARFWIGVALALPGVVAVGLVVGATSALAYAVLGSAGRFLPPLVQLVAVGLVVAGLVWERTRWFVIGALAGLAILIVVLAGVCVALLSGEY